MADYDTQVGVQIDAEFEQAIASAQKMIDSTNSLANSLKGMTHQVNAVSNLTKALKQLQKMNFVTVNQQIDKLDKTLQNLAMRLSKLDLSGITGVSNALRNMMNGDFHFNLTGIEKLEKLPSIMRSISAKDLDQIGNVFATLDDKVTPFIRKLHEARGELENLATAIKGMGAAGINTKKLDNELSKVKAKIKSTGTEADKTGSKIKKVFNVGSMIYLFNMSKQLFHGIGTMISKAVDFGETENLFSVAMRNMRGEALRFQNTLSDTFGLALPDLMKAQGLFENMLSSLKGLNSETSYMLSKTLTKMSIDFASLYNTSIESALTKLQAALSRQVRPIRSVSGYDITQNVLGDSLKQMGIYDRTIAKLSEMEKRLVIIYTLQAQMRASGAMGDFARTIEMPAQQLKILQQQLAETGRWIGAVFMGTVGKVLPYINAFVMVVKELVKSLAMLVGYQIPDSSGVTNVLDQMVGSGDQFGSSIDNANNALDNADKSAKKLKKTIDLMGFDEINKLSEDTSSDTSGSGGIDAGFIDPRILNALGDYDNLMGNVKMKAQDIRDRIMEWLGFTKTINGLTNEVVWKLKDGYTNIEKIRDIVAAVGIGFLSWKLSKDLIKILLLGAEGVPLFKGVKELQKLLIAGGINASFTKLLAVVAGVAATIAVIGLRLYDLINSSEDFRRGIGVITDFVKLLFGAIKEVCTFAISGFAKIGEMLGLNEEEARGLALRLGAMALLFTPAGPFALAYLIFDTIAESIKKLGEAFAPAIEQTDVLSDACEQTKTNLEPMLETMNTMETTLLNMSWTKIVPDADTVAEAVNTVDGYCKDLVTHTENAKTQALNTLNDMFERNAQSTSDNVAFTIEEQQKMLDATTSTYDNIEKEVKEKQEQITTIYRNASAENRALSKEEVETIKENQEWLRDTSVKVLSASAEEQKQIMNNIAANADAMSAEQASTVIKHSIETRNKTKTEAEARYQEQIAIANKLKQDGGKANEELADKIIKEATRQKDEATSQADQLHQNVVDSFKEMNPEVAKYIDGTTGDIKTNLDIWVEDFKTGCSQINKNVNEAWDSISQGIADFWNNNVAPWFTIERWQQLGENMKQGILTKFDEFVSWWDNLGIVVWWRNSVEPWFTWARWQELGSDAMSGVRGAIDSVLSWFDPIRNWWNDHIAPWFTWQKWHDLGMGAVDSVVDAFRNFRFPAFKLPHIKWVDGGIRASGWIYDILSALSLPTSLPSLNVQWYKNGGTPPPGQVFVANEPGNPELIGNFGGYTGVANQGMIIQSMENAMIRGMSRVVGIRQQGGDLHITMKLDDGRTIEKFIKNYNQYITNNGGEGGIIV